MAEELTKRDVRLELQYADGSLMGETGLLAPEQMQELIQDFLKYANEAQTLSYNLKTFGIQQLSQNLQPGIELKTAEEAFQKSLLQNALRYHKKSEGEALSVAEFTQSLDQIETALQRAKEFIIDTDFYVLQPDVEGTSYVVIRLDKTVGAILKHASIETDVERSPFYHESASREAPSSERGSYSEEETLEPLIIEEERREPSATPEPERTPRRPDTHRESERGYGDDSLVEEEPIRTPATAHGRPIFETPREWEHFIKKISTMGGQTPKSALNLLDLYGPRSPDINYLGTQPEYFGLPRSISIDVAEDLINALDAAGGDWTVAGENLQNAGLATDIFRAPPARATSPAPHREEPRREEPRREEPRDTHNPDYLGGVDWVTVEHKRTGKEMTFIPGGSAEITDVVINNGVVEALMIEGQILRTATRVEEGKATFRNKDITGATVYDKEGNLVHNLSQEELKSATKGRGQLNVPNGGSVEIAFAPGRGPDGHDSLMLQGDAVIIDKKGPQTVIYSNDAKNPALLQSTPDDIFRGNPEEKEQTFKLDPDYRLREYRSSSKGGEFVGINLDAFRDISLADAGSTARGAGAFSVEKLAALKESDLGMNT